MRVTAKRDCGLQVFAGGACGGKLRLQKGGNNGIAKRGRVERGERQSQIERRKVVAVW